MAQGDEATSADQRKWFACSRELDKVFFCATPRHQFEVVYRDGEFDDCKDLAVKLWDCLKGQQEGVNRPVAIVQAEDHVWTFKERPRWECGDVDRRRS